VAETSPRSCRSRRLESARADPLWSPDVLYGEGMAAVEGFDRLLPGAGDEDGLREARAARPRRLPDRTEIA